MQVSDQYKETMLKMTLYTELWQSSLVVKWPNNKLSHLQINKLSHHLFIKQNAKMPLSYEDKKVQSNTLWRKGMGFGWGRGLKHVAHKLHVVLDYICSLQWPRQTSKNLWIALFICGTFLTTLSHYSNRYKNTVWYSIISATLVV